MPNFIPKLPLAHALLALPAIFFVAVVILSGVLSLVRAHPRFRPQRFARRAGFGLGVLTRHSSGSAAPPTEFRR